MTARSCIILILLVILSGLAVADKEQLIQEVDQYYQTHNVDIPKEHAFVRLYQESRGVAFATSGWSAGLAQFTLQTSAKYEQITDECWKNVWRSYASSKGGTRGEAGAHRFMQGLAAEYIEECNSDNDVYDYRTWVPKIDWRYNREKALDRGIKYLNEQYLNLDHIEDEEVRLALAQRAYHSGPGTVRRAIKATPESSDHTEIMDAIADTWIEKRFPGTQCEACKDWNAIRLHLYEYLGYLPEGTPDTIDCSKYKSCNNRDAGYFPYHLPDGSIVVKRTTIDNVKEYVYKNTGRPAKNFPSCIYVYENNGNQYYYRIDGEAVTADGTPTGDKSGLLGKEVVTYEKRTCGEKPPEKYDKKEGDDKVIIKDIYGYTHEYDIMTNNQEEEYMCSEVECTTPEGRLTDEEGNRENGRSKIIGRKVVMEKKNIGNFGYTVKSGDTLWSIAKDFIKSSGINEPSSKQVKLKVDKIVSQNELDDPDDISVGEELKIYPVYDMCNIAEKEYPKSIDPTYEGFMEYCEYLECKESSAIINYGGIQLKISIIDSQSLPSFYMSGADTIMMYNKHDNTFHLKGLAHQVYKIADILRSSGVLKHTNQYPCLGFKEVFEKLDSANSE